MRAGPAASPSSRASASSAPSSLRRQALHVLVAGGQAPHHGPQAPQVPPRRRGPRGRRREAHEDGVVAPVEVHHLGSEVAVDHAALVAVEQGPEEPVHHRQGAIGAPHESSTTTSVTK